MIKFNGRLITRLSISNKPIEIHENQYPIQDALSFENYLVGMIDTTDKFYPCNFVFS